MARKARRSDGATAGLTGNGAMAGSAVLPLLQRPASLSAPESSVQIHYGHPANGRWQCLAGLPQSTAASAPDAFCLPLTGPWGLSRISDPAVCFFSHTSPPAPFFSSLPLFYSHTPTSSLSTLTSFLTTRLNSSTFRPNLQRYSPSCPPTRPRPTDTRVSAPIVACPRGLLGPLLPCFLSQILTSQSFFVAN